MKNLIFCFFFLPIFCSAQSYVLKPVAKATEASYRGLSILNDHSVWISGSKGNIAKSDDGLQSWQAINPIGFDKMDFRAIKALDENTALVVNAGSPAYILKTVDTGKSWKETYKNTDTAIFLDGLSFWDKKQGLVFGDPINNKLQLLKTIDGGENWKDISNNLKFKMAPGEASFAASNSTMKMLPGGLVWIATGGTASNIYFSADYGLNWNIYNCPIWQGENSTGIFSIDFYDRNNGVAVGGNYLKDKENPNNILLTKDGGKTWHKPKKTVLGYRSSVCYINKNTLIATGTSGTDLSADAGQTWYTISDLGFNVVQKAEKGNLILLTGAKGLVYQLLKK